MARKENDLTACMITQALQTFAMALGGLVLGKKYGTISTVLYVLLGLIGVPVYAGMSAGPGVLFGVTGGYIFGFVLMTFFCGLGIEFEGKKNGVFFTMLFSIIGLACCHILGIIQLKVVAQMGWGAAAMAGTVPYLVKDILSVGCSNLPTTVIAAVWWCFRQPFRLDYGSICKKEFL